MKIDPLSGNTENLRSSIHNRLKSLNEARLSDKGKRLRLAFKTAPTSGTTLIKLLQSSLTPTHCRDPMRSIHENGFHRLPTLYR